MSRFQLFQEANAADAAWMAEIARLFGAGRAGQMRVQGLADGAPGSLLRVLHDRCVEARCAYRAT
jgi:hypothetical protein